MGSVFGLERRQAFPEPIVPPYPGWNPSNAPDLQNDPNLALTVSACWAAIALLAHTVSSLSLGSFKQPADPLAPPKPVADAPLIAMPAAGVTQSEWLDQVMVSLLTAGNTYGKIVARDEKYERPSQIEIMSPRQLIVEFDEDTQVITYRSRKSRKEIPAYDMWHLAGMTLPGEKIGLSPISYAAAVLGIDISSRKFAADFFDGGGIPKAILTTDQPVDKTKARTIKDRFIESLGNKREPLVVGNGVKYQQISVRPEESQFLKTQEAGIGHVARFYGVPAGMIGGVEGGGMTYTNREQRGIDFLTYSVAWWLKRIEQSLSLLLAGPNFVKFDTDELLRTDAETRATIDVQMVAAKVEAPSEIRTRRGLPPMTQEQKDESALVPLTILPTGKAKALPPGHPLPPDPADPGAVPAAPTNGPAK